MAWAGRGAGAAGDASEPGKAAEIEGNEPE